MFIIKYIIKIKIDKNITYYGFLDVKLNKVLYNVDKEITKFIPYSNYEMLAITPTSAYKVCIIKNNNDCLETCTNGNLILDIEGNKCQDDCDPGKIKFMPQEICIHKEDCDLNYYTFNSDETQCGLCKYINQDGAIYKLINSPDCVSEIPNHSYVYNSYLNLLKCNDNYHLDNNQCIPNYCFETCATCSEISNDETQQKCLSCKDNHLDLIDGNCIEKPTPTTNILLTTEYSVQTEGEITPTTNILLTTEYSNILSQRKLFIRRKYMS